MGKIWEPKSNEILDVKLEPRKQNKQVFCSCNKEQESYSVSFPLVKLGAFPKQFFTS